MIKNCWLPQNKQPPPKKTYRYLKKTAKNLNAWPLIDSPDSLSGTSPFRGITDLTCLACPPLALALTHCRRAFLKSPPLACSKSARVPYTPALPLRQVLISLCLILFACREPAATSCPPIPFATTAFHICWRHIALNQGEAKEEL